MKSVLIFLLLNSFCIFAHEASEFISANNLFAASIYREILKEGPENFLVSPFSAEVVLALVQSGARSETAEELQICLHLPKNQEKIAFAVKSTLPALKNNQNYSLHVANKIYLQENYVVKEEFKKIATEIFYSDLENIDFSQKSDAANKMNQWVENNTGNKIHNLISPDAIDSDTRVVLINALYFQGNWSKSFNPVLTKEDDFYENGEKLIQVSTMHDYSDYYNYYENSQLNAKFLQIPFKDERASMILVLPNEKDGLVSLENRIGEVLAPQKYAKKVVNVALPRFKIEKKVDFKKILKNLGVTKAFIQGVADFSGLSDEKLAIDKIFQKTFIDVEGGVEAAAATYASMTRYSLNQHFPPSNVVEFIADHPFIFYVTVKDFIIFAGRVVTPKQD